MSINSGYYNLATTLNNAAMGTATAKTRQEQEMAKNLAIRNAFMSRLADLLFGDRRLADFDFVRNKTSARYYDGLYNNSYLGRALGLGGGGGVGAGGFMNPTVRSYTAGLVGAPTQGARTSANRVAEAANQRATTETGLAVAGGAYGTGRGALAAGGYNRAAAGAQARALGAELLESDLDRQQQARQFDAAQRQAASIEAARLQEVANARRQALLNQLFASFGGG